MRAPHHRGWLAHRGRVDGYIDHAGIGEDGHDVEFTTEIERLEQAIVDRNVARDLLYPGGGHLCGQRLVTRQRIGFGQDRVAERVCLVMIVFRVGYRTVGVGASTHGEIARSLDDEIPVQHTGAVHAALFVYRRVVVMLRTHLVQQFPDSERLAHRSDVEHFIGVVVDQHFPGFGVDDPERPRRPLVGRLIENGLDVGGHPGVGLGAAIAAAE